MTYPQGIEQTIKEHEWGGAPDLPKEGIGATMNNLFDLGPENQRILSMPLKMGFAVLALEELGGLLGQGDGMVIGNGSVIGDITEAMQNTIGGEHSVAEQFSPNGAPYVDITPGASGMGVGGQTMPGMDMSMGLSPGGMF